MGTIGTTVAENDTKVVVELQRGVPPRGITIPSYLIISNKTFPNI